MLVWVTLAVVIVAAVVGFRKGLISQLGSLAAFVCALIACRLFGSSLETIVPFSSPYVASAVSFALVYAIVYIAIRFIARALKVITHTLMLGLPDRIAGALFNLFKWMMVYSILLNVFIAISGHEIDPGLPGVKQSVEFAPKVLGYVSDVLSEPNDTQDVTSPNS